jgi:dimethylamine/trimethylamine dehydrogenase
MNDGIGRRRQTPIIVSTGARIGSVESLLNGEIPAGPRVLIYDDDHYYMAPVLALKLAAAGLDVTLLTSAGRVCAWGDYTEEMFSTNAALLSAGVKLVTNQVIESMQPGHALSRCIFSANEQKIEADWLLPVSRRQPLDSLYHELVMRQPGIPSFSIRRIGDVEAPGTIAAAVYSGYLAASELDKDPAIENWPRRERGV